MDLLLSFAASVISSFALGFSIGIYISRRDSERQLDLILRLKTEQESPRAS